MDRLWAPWRQAYIRPKKPRKGCFFCQYLSEKKDAGNYILKRSRHSFAILNLYPYNNGHVMIVPKRHVPTLDRLSPAEKLDWLELYEEIFSALEKGLRPNGFNVGMNLGEAAGAGVPGHMHLHVVPRWRGDTNFIPVIGKTKVISESMDSVFKLLTRNLKSRRGAKQR